VFLYHSLYTLTINTQEASTGSSRRGSGRPATNGNAARPPATQPRKGLAQTRRPARLATPEEDEEEEPDEEQEEEDDDDASATEEGGQRMKRAKGLAADVSSLVWRNLI
jgi:hypothetical protein